MAKVASSEVKNATAITPVQALLTPNNTEDGGATKTETTRVAVPLSSSLLRKTQYLPPTSEEIIAGKTILAVWKRRKNLRVWWQTIKMLKDKQKHNFSIAVLSVMVLVDIIVFVRCIFYNNHFQSLGIAINMYCTLIVWVITLPLKRQWYVGLAGFLTVLFYSVYLSVKFIGGDWVFVILFLVSMLTMLAFVKLLNSMSIILKHTYEADVHGLASRLVAKLIAGIPVLCYFALIQFSCVLSREYIYDDLCKYMPGAYFDAKGTRSFTFKAGEWKNCTTGEQLERNWPETVVTTNDVMLEEGLKGYVEAYDLRKMESFLQSIEFSVLIVLSQLLLRICRLSVNDIISLRISKWEMGLAMNMLIQIVIISIYGGQSLEWMTKSEMGMVSYILFVALYFSWGISFALTVKLTRDAATVMELEIEFLNTTNPKTLKSAPSITMIMQRSRRQSVVSSVSAPSVDEFA